MDVDNFFAVKDKKSKKDKKEKKSSKKDAEGETLMELGIGGFVSGLGDLGSVDVAASTKAAKERELRAKAKEEKGDVWEKKPAAAAGGDAGSGGGDPAAPSPAPEDKDNKAGRNKYISIKHFC